MPDRPAAGEWDQLSPLERPRAPETVRRGDRDGSRRGQMTIIVAVMATALLAFLALTIDGGYAFSQRRAMQNAADAAALAGARQLAAAGVGDVVVDTTISSTVRQAATNNGWNSTTGSLSGTYVASDLSMAGTIGGGTVPTPARGVAVTTTIPYNTFFAGFIGLNQLTAQATAQAIWGYVCSADCLMPITVFTQTWVAGGTYTLLDSSNGPGNFGWLCFTGTCSANDLITDLTPGGCTSGTKSVYQWTIGNSGISASSGVDAALAQWVGKTVGVVVFGPGPGTDPGGSGCTNVCPNNNCPASCGTGGNLQYHIISVASFQIVGYDLNSNPKKIVLKYVNSVQNRQLSSGCTTTTGIQAVNLVH